MLYMYKEPPKAILLVDFGLFGDNFFSQFYLVRNKTTEIMERACEVGPKSLQKNFRVEELFSARNVSRYFSV